MIELKKLNGTSIFVNPDMIRVVESTPDTLVNFLDGESLLVLNSPQEIVERIVLFRKKYFVNSMDMIATRAQLTEGNIE